MKTVPGRATPYSVAGSDDLFDNLFEPITNPLSDNLLYDLEDIPGPMVASERFSADMIARIWTVVDGDNGRMYAIPGIHYVNRVGYLYCENTRGPGHHRNYIYGM